MKTALVLITHAAVSSPAALVIARHSLDPVVTRNTLWILALASAGISAAGFLATAAYLSKRLRRVSAVVIGLLCGVLCAAITSMTTRPGSDFSLILYLALLSPALLAVMLATMLDRSKSGWQ